MSSGDLLNVHPTQLKFSFELKKQSSCSLQLANKTDKYVAFKVKTTNPRKYSVRPNTGIISPGMTCDITVTMQAQKEAPVDMQCKDKFLLQSVVVSHDTTTKDITPEMFNKEAEKVVEEFKFKVVYIPANLSSPVPKGSSPSTTGSENGSQNSSLFDAVSKSVEELKEKSSEVWSAISKLTEEKTSAIERSQMLQQELELMRKEAYKNRAGGIPFKFVLIVGLLGFLVGYLMKK